MLANPKADIPESGAALAMKALGLGTLFAVSGVGGLVFGVCKLIGVKNVSSATNRGWENQHFPGNMVNISIKK